MSDLNTKPRPARNDNAGQQNCDTTTLYVGSLHPRVLEVHLQKLFEPFGIVKRCYLKTRAQPTATASTYGGQHNTAADRIPQNYAFVEMESISSARRAMMKLNGRELLRKTLVVRPANQQKQYQQQSGGSSGSNGCSREKSPPKSSIKHEKKELEDKISSLKRAIEEKRKRMNNV
uniref:RRM domain-containing protein n=1 Tax=Leptocylindrus danicus TaxID=163516 RepID=A0A7S2PNA3_9STRA